MKTLLYNAKVWLSDNHFAESIGIDDVSGKINFIGKNLDANKKLYDTVIDLGGKLVLPAFTDGHMHLIRGSLIRTEIDLSSVSTRKEIADTFAEYKQNLKKDDWVTGGYFSETSFKENIIINRNLLDDICPEFPVAISRIDLHSIVANSKAIELTGINNMIGKFGNDEIITDSENNLTGELKERAMYYMLERLPKKSYEEISKAVRAEVERLHKFGIVSVTDIFWNEYFDYYKELLDNKILNLKINSIIPFEDFPDFNKYKNTFDAYKQNFRINSFKAYYDGSLSSEAALFENDYTGTNYKGLRTELVNSGEFQKLAFEIDKAGYQIAVHAIGDKAVSELLDFIAELINKNGIRDRRFRIEHAQHIKPEDIYRFKKLGAVASVQPSHLYFDAKTATEKLQNPGTTHLYKLLIDDGAKVCFGTDFPVASENPFETIYYAMTRKAIGFPDGFNAQYNLDLINCLNAYTINNAYASFEKKERGSIQAGKCADLIVLKDDLFSISAEEIKDVKVEMTFMDGKRVY